MRIEGFYNKQTREGGYLVKVDGKPLALGPSLKLRNHSPTGFSWGFAGSGPAQLSLALLLIAGIDKDVALQLYQTFKVQHVMRWKWQENFVIDLDVRAWAIGAIAAKHAAEGEPEAQA